MQFPVIFLLMVLFAAGCSWSPVRDNPVDPKSPYYSEPPQRNRAPEIDSVYIQTNCQHGDLDNFCGFTLSCLAHDLDNNLLYNSAQVSIEGDTTDWEPLGTLLYDPIADVFSLTRYESDFASGSLGLLINRRVRAVVEDDSGAVDEATIVFPPPVEVYPQITYPNGYINNPTHVNTVLPRLTWPRWSGTTPHTYSVGVDLYGFIPAWDSSGIAAIDSFVVVTDSLLSSRLNAAVFYVWRLTVVDNHGNRMTSVPGAFECFPDSESVTLTDPSLANAE